VGEATATDTGRRYRHDALLHDSPEHLVQVAAPFLLEGLADGEAAVVATGTVTADLLREAVDGDPRVHVLDRGDVYRARTPAAITTFRQLAEARVSEGALRVRIVGEVDFGPTERDWLEWQRYEAVINHALAGWPLWGLCLFDTQRLPEPLLASALRTHSRLATAHGPEENRLFAPPADYLRDWRCRSSRWRPHAPACTPPTSPTSPPCGGRWPPSWPGCPLTRTCSRTSCWPSTR
jgi:hypothetical protein